jgi:hypothetical protein
MTNETLLADLRALDFACGKGTNKHDRVIVLIHACIDAGCNTKEAIQEALRLLGWNLQHARIILSSSTGNNPNLHRWQRDEAGVYRNHI